MPKLLGELVSVDEAVSRAVEKIEIKLNTVEENVWEASGLVLAEDFVARIDQPRFDRSAVDGYAVRSADVLGASPLNPVVLGVKGVMKPGDDPGKYSIGEGEAVEIYTGAPLPRGADAVVMYEDTNRMGEYVEIYKSVSRYANVSRRGEDFRKGELLIKAPTLLRPWHLAVMSANGVDRVKVYERLRVGVIVTGDEIVEPGHPLSRGEIYNSTGVLVYNYLSEISFIEPRYYGVFPDNREVLEKILSKALRENHVVVTTGGSSVSEEDVIRDIIDEKGEWIVRGVAMRPGRPTSIAIVEDKPVFMLSGFPVAAWTGLEALFTPIIHKALGLNPPTRPVVRARLERRLPNTVGYRSYIRVKLACRQNECSAEPYMLKGSGILSSLVKSNGYIVIPEHLEGYEEGEIVEVHIL